MKLDISLVKTWHFIKSIRTVRRHVVGIAIISSIVGAILLDVFIQHAGAPIEYTAETAHAEEIEVEEAKTVLIEEKIDWTPERVKQEIRKVFPENAETMIRVAQCESGLLPAAKGPTNDHGIFQLHMPSHRKEIEKQGIDVTDPAENIQFARYLYDHGGLGHWKASRKCWQR